MSHSPSVMARARSRCPQYRGYADLVRDALVRIGERASPYKLTLACGLSLEQVRRGLQSLMSSGGIVSEKDKNGVTYYSIWKPKPKATSIEKGPYAIAGRITIPQYRYGGTRLG